MSGPLAGLHLALLHWPCLDREGAFLATATTNLDIHDIARLATTYGIAGYWVVQPLASQRGIAERIVAHWTSGPGRLLHPDRPRALRVVRVVATLDEVGAAIGPATWIATSARPPRVTLTVDELGRRLVAGSDRPQVLMLGTGWGLAPQVLAAADELLEPIRIGAYDHLSVRSAASIYVDRIWRAIDAVDAHTAERT